MPTGQSDNKTTLYWVTAAAARRVVVALHVVALVAVLIEFVFPFPADGHAVERAHALDFAGSYAAYGFISCVLLVLLGILLRRLVMRREDYYGERGR